MEVSITIIDLIELMVGLILWAGVSIWMLFLSRERDRLVNKIKELEKKLLDAKD